MVVELAFQTLTMSTKHGDLTKFPVPGQTSTLQIHHRGEAVIPWCMML